MNPMMLVSFYLGFLTVLPSHQLLIGSGYETISNPKEAYMDIPIEGVWAYQVGVQVPLC